MQDNSYKESVGISQSAIKCFKNKGLKKFKKIYIDKEDDDESQTKYALGSLTDTLAFSPDLIDKRFYITDTEVNIPSEKVRPIVEKVYDAANEHIENVKNLNLHGNLPETLYVPNINDIYEFAESVYTIAKDHKYGGADYSKSRVIKEICEKGGMYFVHLSRACGRTIVTNRDNADAIEMVEELRKNPLTKPYFVQQENETLLFQQELYIDYEYEKGKNVKLKGAIDIIRFNHNNKTVIAPDFKTTYDCSQLPFQAKEYGYGTQASFYDFLVNKWLLTYEDGKYADYTLLNPINIAIDRVDKIPHIFEYRRIDLDIARDGDKDLFVTGWKDTLKDICWHIENDIWDKPKELCEEGKIQLKLYRI